MKDDDIQLQDPYENLMSELAALRARNLELETALAGRVASPAPTQPTVRQARHEHFRQMVEQNVDGVIVVGEEGKIRFANGSAVTMLGHLRHELLGQKFWLPSALESAAEIPINQPDGQPGIGEMQSTEIGWEDDIALLHSIRDITDRIRSRQALRRSTHNLRQVLEHSLTGIAVIRNEQVVYKNSAYEVLFGEVTGNFPHVDCVKLHPDDVDNVSAFNAAMRAEVFELTDVEFRMFPPTDAGRRPSMRWLHVRGQPFEFEGRDAIIINVADITKSKELEQLLSIHDRMTSLGRLASGLIHDIRNSLSSINLHASVLLRMSEQADTNTDRIIANIQQASSRIEAIVGRVQDFSRPSEPRLRATDLHAVIEESTSLCQATLSRREIELELKLANELPSIPLDRHLIMRVLVNLITNAIEAVQSQDIASRSIRIVTQTAEDRAAIRIADSGPGVPEALSDIIFDPFFTTKTEGTGIGLNIAYRIVADHGGLMYVTTSDMGGAEVVVELPMREAESLL